MFSFPEGFVRPLLILSSPFLPLEFLSSSVPISDRGERGKCEESWRWNGNGRGLWRCSDSFASALLVSLAMVSSDRSLGIEEAAKRLVPSVEEDETIEYEPLPTAPTNNEQKGARMTEEVEMQVSVLQNIYWKELGLLVFVWISFLVLQITKIPISISVTLYEAIGIYRGDKVIASRGVQGLSLKVSQLLVYCSSEIVGGIVGGLLGLGGGFILGPLFLELGIPRQVILVAFMITLVISFMRFQVQQQVFAMTFSSSMSVVEYYL
ncbi:hypothetical protein ZIOFF_029253 [Zingiber officinale]|uniref:Sulfite exporter TauE/SafE family protein n=1 Tax=Zingiber officinale TaxID=94328 RepID=A0A8J5LFZ2_ZINOF|nr:hypothetical protein ZIOFF_029253 [Zingiber officinale]